MLCSQSVELLSRISISVCLVKFDEPTWMDGVGSSLAMSLRSKIGM